MERGERRSWAVRAGLLAALTCVLAPSASASSIPRWLKAPYEHYTLTYEASDSSHGTIEGGYATAPAGFTLCEFATYQEHGTQTLHAVVRYAVIFGRYKGKLALTYKAAGRSATGKDALVNHEGYPAGCPAGGRFPEGPQTAECTQALGLEDPPELEFGANIAQTKFGLSLAVSISSPEEPSCTGNQQAATDLHPGSWDLGAENGEVPTPTVATMTFTASQIKARRTVHGKVATNPEHAALSGGATEAQSSGEQVVWSFVDTPNYSLTLAPAATAETEARSRPSVTAENGGSGDLLSARRRG